MEIRENAGKGVCVGHSGDVAIETEQTEKFVYEDVLARIGVTPLNKVWEVLANLDCCLVNRQFSPSCKDSFYVDHQYSPWNGMNVSMDDDVGLVRRTDPLDKGYLSDKGSFVFESRTKSFLEELGEEEDLDSSALNE
ncbi:unnamed protein product, partial [Ilex paraguariensis]